MADMALANRGKRAAWPLQAAGLVNSGAAPATTAAVAVDRGGNASTRRQKLALVTGGAPADPACGPIEIELARELDKARAKIAHLERRLSVESTAARASRERVQTSAEAVDGAGQRADVAEKRAKELDTELRVTRRRLGEQIDEIRAENTRLYAIHADRGLALDDAHERIKALESDLAAAQASLPDAPAGSLGGGSRVDGERQRQHALLVAENTRLTQAAAAKDAALDDARARIDFLQTALAAAEAECTRFNGELAGARERLQSEAATQSGLLKAMTERATAAEKFLAEARERLLARIVEIDAVRQKAAAAKAESQEAYARHRELEDALCLRQREVEELERSRSSLVEATQALMATFEERRRALSGAEEKIRHLAVRNAILEVGADSANRADGGTDTPIDVAHSGGGDATIRKDWAELARLLSDLMERKRQSMGEHARSVTVLAGTVTF